MRLVCVLGWANRCGGSEMMKDVYVIRILFALPSAARNFPPGTHTLLRLSTLNSALILVCYRLIYEILLHLLLKYTERVFKCIHAECYDKKII